MIKMVQFGMQKNASVTNYSPFCVKLETLLRGMQVEFETEAFSGDPAKFPKGKLPVIKDQDQLIEDSDFIYQYLLKQGYKDLDKDLTEQQRAQGLSIRIMIEQSMIWCMLYLRWQDQANWQSYAKQAFFAHLPPVIRTIVAIVARKGVVKSLHGHGMGRFSKQQVKDIASSQLKALSVLLGEQDYFFGDNITTLDCSAFGLLCNFMAAELCPELSDLVKPHQNLVDFIARIRTTLF